MKKIVVLLGFCIVVLTACSSNNLSGKYIAKDGSFNGTLTIKDEEAQLTFDSLTGKYTINADVNTDKGVLENKNNDGLAELTNSEEITYTQTSEENIVLNLNGQEVTFKKQ
ncbi:hypothetical protein [Streptococcus pluranimalium]|uniref:hypothetical protein n=1 Tax=Streptococcus pluranimalium TaxID=82348 RepID=UPI003F68E9DD